MNKKIILFILLISAFFASCSDLEDIIDVSELPPLQTKKLLILSEGGMGLNNSTLALFDLRSNFKDLDYFQTTNNRGLGDTANDILKYGSKIYLVINGSSVIEIINVENGKSLKQIPLKTTDGKSKQPRSIAAYGGKVYITSFDDTVTRIDTTLLSVDANITVGQDPEGICIKNNKIYVANSGGLNFMSGDYDKTVSVINLQSFKEEKKIEVGMNPNKIYADSEGDIYVNIRGNYTSEPAAFKKITPSTGVVSTIENVVATEFVLVNDKAYILLSEWGKPSVIKVYDCLSEKLTTETFISDGTVIDNGYKINVDAFSGDVYVNTSDFISAGSTFCFDKNGKLKFKLDKVGLNPCGIVFLN
ncbi:MAG: hypothetical protein PHR13_01260 [Dysgonamonadaceae bacterium]|nr:hypothetical protein [Dysgonamonadaceae bacterium]MDD3899645.1 hypothetical protein [Dysgonamonadaceae bacterium]MDD4398158.1 hypothetical protein [Dysgonamonadaceae bacterium]